VPSITKFGGRLLSSAATAEKASAKITVVSARPAIEADQWARNGLHPDARLTNTIAEAANQAALYRTKEVFHALGRVWSGVASPILSGVAGTRERWRFAFRTGPYAHALGAIVAMVEPDAGYDQNTYATLSILNGAGSTVASAEFVYGVRPIDFIADGSWPHISQIIATIDGLDPDTEYFGVFSDQNYGRLQSACVFELASLSENGGYLAQNVSTQSAVLATHRQYAAEVSNAIWQKGGSQVFNWTVDDGTAPITRSSATFANIIDDTVTTVSASSHGWTLDMTNKARLSQTSGVPITMKVCAKSTVSPAGPGAIKLVDSSGATIASVVGGWTNSPTWQSATGFLPAGVDKYDVHFNSNGAATLSLYALSVYEYG
jgi:hypothetical protein